jgi:hypothetical protein
MSRHIQVTATIIVLALWMAYVMSLWSVVIPHRIAQYVRRRLTRISIAIAVMLCVTVGTISADWQPVPVTEVDSIAIAEVDFFYVDPEICWGIDYNDGDWVVEVITGDYRVETVSTAAGHRTAVGCTRR